MVGKSQTVTKLERHRSLQCNKLMRIAKIKKKQNDYFKCLYFLLWRAPLGWSHYLAPALGFLIMRKIVLVCNLFLLTCQCWSEHTTFYTACLGPFFHLPMVSPQTPMIAMACSATHHQLVHMYWSTGRGGVWTHNPEDCNLKPNHLASRSW